MIAPLFPETLVFNRYRIVGLAGQGEFGLTYLAQDQKRFDELCILKEFTPLQQDLGEVEALRQCFHQAAAALYELQHSQLPHYRIMFVHVDRLYLVRDYVIGKSYSALLNERRAEGRLFSQAEVMQLLLQALPVLAHLHQMGLVHENLSPQSIVLRRQDELPVLVELGLVKRLVAQLGLHPVLPDASIGHRSYLAPEQQKNGKAFPSSDLYSLGAVAIALLAGKDPQELPQRWIRASNWESHVSHPDFARVLRRMVHPNGQKRFASAAQVLRALTPLAEAVLRSELRAEATVTYSDSVLNTVQHQTETDKAPPAIAQANRTMPEAIVPSPADLPREATYPNVSRLSSASVRSSKAIPHAQPRRPRSRRYSVRSKADFKASAILVVSVALLVSVVSFRALSRVQTEPEQPVVPTATPSPAESSSLIAGGRSSPSPAPTVPTREPTAKPSETGSVSTDTMRDRQRQLGVDLQFLSDLTDELFYGQHPDLQGQKLSEDQKDLQNEWTAIANEALGKLEGLSSETRSKLGTYQRSDYDSWVAPGSGASLNNRELNVLVNSRFAELFPQQKGKTLNPKTFGQIWFALAEEELGKLKP